MVLISQITTMRQSKPIRHRIKSVPSPNQKLELARAATSEDRRFRNGWAKGSTARGGRSNVMQIMKNSAKNSPPLI